MRIKLPHFDSDVCQASGKHMCSCLTIYSFSQHIYHLHCSTYWSSSWSSSDSCCLSKSFDRFFDLDDSVTGLSKTSDILFRPSRTSWRERPDARQLVPGILRQGRPDARDILTPGTSWRQGHPDARDILTPKAPNFRALLFFFLLFFLFRARPRLRFFFNRLTFGLYCIFAKRILIKIKSQVSESVKMLAISFKRWPNTTIERNIYILLLLNDHVDISWIIICVVNLQRKMLWKKLYVKENIKI